MATEVVARQHLAGGDIVGPRHLEPAERDPEGVPQALPAPSRDGWRPRWPRRPTRSRHPARIGAAFDERGHAGSIEQVLVVPPGRRIRPRTCEHPARGAGCRSRRDREGDRNPAGSRSVSRRGGRRRSGRGLHLVVGYAGLELGDPRLELELAGPTAVGRGQRRGQGVGLVAQAAWPAGEARGTAPPGACRSG